MILKWVTQMFSLCHSSPTVKLPARNVHTSLAEHCAEIRCCQNSLYLCSCHKELLLLYFSLIERQACSGAHTGSNRLWQCWEAGGSSETTGTRQAEPSSRSNRARQSIPAGQVTGPNAFGKAWLHAWCTAELQTPHALLPNTGHHSH